MQRDIISLFQKLGWAKFHFVYTQQKYCECKFTYVYIFSVYFTVAPCLRFVCQNIRGLSADSM